MKSVRLTIAAMLMSVAASAFAQLYVLPKTTVQNCTGCPGTNYFGQLNDGLPVAPFGAPLGSHVGRLVDSTSQTDFQNIGFRTARAGRVRVAPTQRGSAPPRVYIGIGEALGAYSLDTFYSSRLPGGTRPVTDIPKLFNSVGYRPSPPELISMFDAFVYPEAANSGWTTTYEDGQERLLDFDFDDRGYLYLAYRNFGWGIAQDDGRTGAQMLPKISQRFAEGVGVTPQTIVSLKLGNKYYAITSAPGTTRHALYDVTNPANPSAAQVREGSQWGIRTWDKYEAGQRIAYVAANNNVRVYDYGTFINGGNPIDEWAPPSGKVFSAVAFDESGTLWFVERSSSINTLSHNSLYKATPSSTGYTRQTFSPFGTTRFNGEEIHAAAGFVAVSGRGDLDGTTGLEARILAVDSGTPRLLDDSGFFRRFYSSSQQGWAMPQTVPSYTTRQRGVYIHRYGGNTYFYYSIHGLGDVFTLGSTAPPPTCTSFSINPNSASPVSTAGSQNVSVIGSPSGCAGGSWTTATNADWLTVSPSSGSGSGSASVSWTQNLLTQNRIGTVTIAGNTFSVNQKDLSQSACTGYSINPTSANASSSAGSTGVTITGLPTGCIGTPWTTVSNSNWLSLSAAAGNGNGNVTVQWAQNDTGASRNGSVTIAGNSFAVSQAGPNSCGPLPLEGNIAFSASCSSCQPGQEITFFLSIFQHAINPACDTVTWNMGDGSATKTGEMVSHTYSSGGTYNVRITITSTSGATVTKTTAFAVGSGGGGDPNPGTCSSFALSPSSVSPSATAGGQQVSVIGSPSGCSGGAWSASSNAAWLSVSSANGNGPGNVNVSWTANSGSSRAGTVTIANRTFTVTQASASAGCGNLPPAGAIAVNATCTTGCPVGQAISFSPSIFGYVLQSCDSVSWNMGDGSGTKNGTEISHAYAQSGNYLVTMTISNTTGNIQANTQISVGTIAVKPLPQLSFASGTPSKGSKGTPITLTVNSNMATTTGWSWDFGTGPVDNSQAGVTGQSSSRTFTYAAAGSYTVTVKARNSEDLPTAQTALVSMTIVIEDIPEYRYLLPAVIHMPGSGGSDWRTDVQIYNPDPSVSSRPLKLTAKFKEITRELEVAQATFVYEDFLARILETRPPDGREDQGPVIVTVRAEHAPQIWTRTYNKTADGTFGQYIPAIRLDAGGGSAFGEGRYYLAGLRQNGRYRTNIGLVNPNGESVSVTLRAYDDRGLPIGTATTKSLASFQLDQFSAASLGSVPADRPFSVELEVPAGAWLVAYASLIDGGSNDPVFLRALRHSDLISSDFVSTVVPGVGHAGAWRSDVTIFNPGSRGTSVNLTYRDQTGEKVGEALNVPVGAGQFLQYDDLLKQGVIGNVPDSIGMLQVDVPGTLSSDHVYPLAFARTYNDNGSGMTFGQGIAGFAASRANVKPGKAGLIPTVRSDEGYYTNVGLINLTGSAATVRVYLLDQVTGNATGAYEEFALGPFQSIIRSPSDAERKKDLINNLSSGMANRATLKVEVVSGGNVWAFASVIDRKTNDPEYVAAYPQP